MIRANGSKGRCSLGTTPGLVLSIVCLTLLGTGVAEGNEKIQVTVGQSVTHDLTSTIKTVSIANSQIADVVVAGPKQLLLNGKEIGFTTLVVWDDNDRSKICDVVVRGPFSDQQIELSVNVAEVNRTRARELGVDLLIDDQGEVFSGSHTTLGSYGGGVATPSVPLQIFSGQPGSQGTDIAFRHIHGGRELSAMMHALESRGVLRVLAEPTVVAASGHTASFLAGGEIPIPIASAGAQGGTTVTIDWKEFGVRVKFLPTIVDSGVINLMVSPEVSSLDLNNGINIGGFVVPALRARRAETTVELKDGESLIIGGLIMQEENTLRTRIPVLGHIPLLGFFFTDTKKSVVESELMLTVSPRITYALPEGETIPLPGVGGEADSLKDEK